VLCLTVIYVPDLGRGFIKDDFSWIDTSRVDTPSDVRRMFVETPMGFYRPLVALSFAANRAWFGLDPTSYGLINFLLVVATAGSIGLLARWLGLSDGAAIFAAGVWALNFHGISMSILWISGRASLLMSFFAVWAACMIVTRRFLLAAALTLCALFSKEEPLVLPFVFAAWLVLDRFGGSCERDSPLHGSLAGSGAMLLVLIAYLVIRSNTDAFTPSTAPDFYRWSRDVIGSNFLHYVDRSMTFPTALLLLGCLTLAPRAFSLTMAERLIVAKGAIWLVGGFALTIMLPVRSSLYVCFPSIGAALMAGALGSALWRAIARKRQAVVAMAILPLVLLPVHRARNLQWKNEARLSSTVLEQLLSELSVSRPQRVVLYDNPGERPSLADAFGGSMPTALALFYADAQPIIELKPSQPGQSRPEPSADTMEFMLKDGRLIRM
jgi:hypothetical protein